MFSCLKIVRNTFETINDTVCKWYNGIGCISYPYSYQQDRNVLRNTIKNTFDIKWIDSNKLDIDTLTLLHEANPLLKYLFTHNQMHYYGNRDIVHNSMTNTKFVHINNNDYELIGHVPHYVIIQYIKASYYNTFDINKIKPIDFIDFLHFIDKNPTTALSVNRLDCQIVEYIDKNNILSKSNIDVLKRLSLKHGLKYTTSFINTLN